MQIRALTAEDALAYRELMLEAYGAVPDAYTSTAEERANEPEVWWIKRIGRPGAANSSYAAVEGSNLLGTVAMEYATKPKTRHSALLIGMYVRARARGQGLGAALVSAAVADASRHPEVSIIRLTVTEGNDAAIRLYERAGFRAWGTEPLAIATPTGYKGKVHMQLHLRSNGS